MLEFKYDTQLLIEGENLDEDEMEKFLTDSFQGGCPYYRLEDEYRTVRKQM